MLIRKYFEIILMAPLSKSARQATPDGPPPKYFDRLLLGPLSEGARVPGCEGIKGSETGISACHLPKYSERFLMDPHQSTLRVH